MWMACDDVKCLFLYNLYVWIRQFFPSFVGFLNSGILLEYNRKFIDLIILFDVQEFHSGL